MQCGESHGSAASMNSPLRVRLRCSRCRSATAADVERHGMPKTYIVKQPFQPIWSTCTPQYIPYWLIGPGGDLSVHFPGVYSTNVALVSSGAPAVKIGPEALESLLLSI